MKISVGGVCLQSDTQHGCDTVDVRLRAVQGFAIASKFNKLRCVKGYDLAIIELAEDLEVRITIKD